MSQPAKAAAGSAKVMLLGAIGVGKTSLSRRFVFNRFEREYKSTLGVDIQSHDAVLPGGERLRLVLWDTDGEFGARIFETVYMRGAAGALIVSDVTRPPTLAHAGRLAAGFLERFPGRPARVLVNKTDLGEMPGEAFLEAGLAPADIFRVSAATGAGVEPAILGLAADILRRGL